MGSERQEALTTCTARMFFITKDREAERLRALEQLYIADDVHASRGRIFGRSVVIKDAHELAGVARLRSEGCSLEELGPLYYLWGKCVPAVLYHGYTTDYTGYQLISDFIEGSHPDETSSESAWQAAVRALKILHDEGYGHGNLCRDNIIVTPDDRVFFINFYKLIMGPKASQMKAERQQLDEAFGRSRHGERPGVGDCNGSASPDSTGA